MRRSDAGVTGRPILYENESHENPTKIDLALCDYCPGLRRSLLERLPARPVESGCVSLAGPGCEQKRSPRQCNESNALALALTVAFAFAEEIVRILSGKAAHWVAAFS